MQSFFDIAVVWVFNFGLLQFVELVITRFKVSTSVEVYKFDVLHMTYLFFLPGGFFLKLCFTVT